MTRRHGLAALCALVLAAVPARAQRAEEPRLNAGRVLGETVVGAYAGIGGFVVGRFVAQEVTELLGVRHDKTRNGLGWAGGILGGGLATAGAVYAIGNLGDQTGDFDATYLGTGAGFVAAVGIARLLLGPDGRPPQNSSTAMRWAMANVIALLPAIGGTIGFNSTRRFK